MLSPVELVAICASVIIPIVLFGVGLRNTILKIAEDVAALHMDVEERQALGGHIEQLGRDIQSLTYYIRWLGHEQTGKNPPPMLPTGKAING